MGLQGEKLAILSGIYTGKEILFFALGIFTLLATPFLGADPAGTLQLLVLGAALTLEGCASMVDMGLTFIIEKGIPWYERKWGIKKIKN